MQRTALITGATSGIGLAISEKLASEGYKLIITGRRTEKLDALKLKLESEYSLDIHTLNFDIRNKQEVDNAIDSLPAEFATIDILVNNAGLAAGLSTIDTGNIDDWEQMIDTNIKGLLYITRKVSPAMVIRKSGHIINIGSTAGKEVYLNGNVYCGTKHAVNAISQSMRIDMLPHGIKVTQIKPGLVDTEFSLVRFKGDTEKAKTPYQDIVPLYGPDIAEAVSFVLSRPASVNINDIEITCTAQANSFYVHREK